MRPLFCALFRFLLPLLMALPLQAQVPDSSNTQPSVPPTKWLSDSLFEEKTSLPPPKDSVSALHAVLPASIPPAYQKPKHFSIKGISDKKKQQYFLQKAQETADTIQLRRKLLQLCQEEISRGFLAYELVGIRQSKDSVWVEIFEGRRHVWGSLGLKNLPPEKLRRYELDKISKPNRPVNMEAFATALRSVLNEYQNNGYPFAYFSQPQIRYEPKGADTLIQHLDYQFETGKKFTIDSIIFEGRHRETNRFLYSMIRLSPEDMYRQNLIDDIPRILNNSIYYKNVKNPKLEFNYLGQAKIRIPMESRRANKFDALVGLLPPDNSSSSTDRQFQWIGTLDVMLVSPLRRGEQIQLKYDKLTATSSRMQAKLQVPYLFHLPLHIQGEGELFRQLTDFQNLQAKAGVEYGFSPLLAVRAYYRTRQTGLGETYIQEVLEGKKRLQTLDGSQNAYFVGFKYEKLDYKFNPSNGISTFLDIGTGSTVIRKNKNLSNQVYDTLALTRVSDTRWSQQMQELDFSFKWYKKFGRRNVLHLANRSYYLFQKRIFQNDQIPLGGSKNIRGFNENQFFSDRYTYFTAEYRLLLSQNSYLFGFSDAAWLRDNASRNTYQPIGFGLGLTYDTPAGIVSFTYAVGKVGDIAFQPTRGKIHVGFVSQF